MVVTVVGLALLIPLVVTPGASAQDPLGILDEPPFLIPGGVAGNSYAASYHAAVAAGATETEWRIDRSDLSSTVVDAVHDGDGLILVTGAAPTVVAKLSADGAPIYSTPIPRLQPRAIALDGDGNAVVAGWAYSAEPTGHTWYEMVVAKLDPAGRVLWTTVVGPGGVVDLEIDADGNAILIGDHVTAPGDWHRNVLVAKVAPDGAVLDVTDFGNPFGFYYITHGTVLGNGDVVVAMHTMMFAPTTYVGRFAADGTFLGKAPYDQHDVHGITATADGDVVLHTTHREQVVELIPHRRACTMRLTPALEESWRTCLLVGQSTYGGDVELDASGDIVVTGTAQTYDSVLQPNPASAPGPLLADTERIEQYVAKLAPDGTPLILRITGEHEAAPRTTSGRAVAASPVDGAIHAAGAAASPDPRGPPVLHVTRSAADGALGGAAAATQLALDPIVTAASDPALSPWPVTDQLPWYLVPWHLLP